MKLKNIGFTVLFVLALAIFPASAKNIYVDAHNGKDSNPGTLEKPFRTIQHAANKMVSGDVCYIRSGVYRETLTPAKDGLTFKKYENEYVLITGLDEVKGWTPYQGEIWKAGFTRTTPPGSFKASMVFLNGKRMNWARYPNEDGNMLNNQDMNQVEVGADTTSGPRYLGTVVFDGLSSQSKKSWQGAYFMGLASYNIGAWFTANKGLVQESYGDSLIVKDISWNWNNGAKKGRFLGEGYGYLIGHMNALDSETEWHLQNDTLYFYPPANTDMNLALIEARKRILGMDLSGRRNITVEGIHFKAAGVKMEESENCVIDVCTFRYASGFTAFSENAWGDYKNGDGGIYMSGNNNTVKDCYIGQTWGNGISMWGDHNTLENSIVEHCNWQAERLANVSCPGDDNIIRGNTVRYGAREGIELGNNSWVGKYARRALIQYNHVHDLGMLCPDGGLFYVNHQGGNKPLANTEISYNIWHDYPSADFPRPHGGIYLDNMSSGYTIHHNVIWNVISGIHMNDISLDNNTHDVHIYHNTIINCKHLVRMNQGQKGSINTRNIIVQNNRSDGSEIEGTQLDHNRSDRWDNDFVDARIRNYRLKPSSKSINAGVVLLGINDNAVGAPDLGAYEFNGEDWTAGSSLEVPDFPDENLSMKVYLSLVLHLNADKGLTIEEDNMVTTWTNQAPNAKAIDFKITEEGRTKTIISQDEPGTGRPMLLKNSHEINGHNSLVFTEDELINDNDEAFHGMMTGGGYTWFAVIKPYKQRGPGKINSRYPNAFFGCLRNSGPPQKETGQYAGFWGSFYPDGRVYMGSRNGLNEKVRDGVNTPEVEGPPPAENEWHIIMGRQGSGQDTVLLELFVNDPSKAVNSSDFPVGDVEPTRMAIGTERNAINHQGKESFDGELARLLMFETALDQKQMKEVYDYLRKLYFE